jgi:hypothetical protein
MLVIADIDETTLPFSPEEAQKFWKTTTCWIPTPMSKYDHLEPKNINPKPLREASMCVTVVITKKGLSRVFM